MILHCTVVSVYFCTYLPVSTVCVLESETMNYMLIYCSDSFIKSCMHIRISTKKQPRLKKSVALFKMASVKKL